MKKQTRKRTPLLKALSTAMALLTTAGSLCSTGGLKAFAATGYLLWIDGVQVTSANASGNILDSRYFQYRYVAKDNILYLEGSGTPNTDRWQIQTAIPDLVISLDSDVSLQAENSPYTQYDAPNSILCEADTLIIGVNHQFDVNQITVRNGASVYCYPGVLKTRGIDVEVNSELLISDGTLEVQKDSSTIDLDHSIFRLESATLKAPFTSTYYESGYDLISMTNGATLNIKDSTIQAGLRNIHSTQNGSITIDNSHLNVHNIKGGYGYGSSNGDRLNITNNSTIGAWQIFGFDSISLYSGALASDSLGFELYNSGGSLVKNLNGDLPEGTIIKCFDYDNPVAGHSVAFDASTGVLYLRGEVNKEDLDYFRYDNRVKKVEALSGTTLPQDCSELFKNFRASEFVSEYSSSFNVTCSNATDMSGMFANCTKLTSLKMQIGSNASVTSMASMFSGCSNLTSVELDYNRTSNPLTDMSAMFKNCTALREVNLKDFNTENVLDMSEMFSGCSSLETLDLSSFRVFKVKYMKNMFLRCSDLSTIYVSSDNWRTLSLNTPCTMFMGCSSLVGGNGFAHPAGEPGSGETIDSVYARIDTAEASGYLTENAVSLSGGTLTLHGHVSYHQMSEYANNASVTKVVAAEGTVLPTDCSDLFRNFKAKEIDLSCADTSNVEHMSGMFAECPNLEKINLSGFDTSNVYTMERMFWYTPNLKDLDLSSFNTINVATMESMFMNSGVKSINVVSFDTSNTRDMSMMFEGCTNLTELKLISFNTGNVTNMSWMFRNCSNLKTVYVSDTWTTANVTYDGNMFSGCISIQGEKGTAYDESNIGKTYARIDTAGAPGYFSATSVRFDAATGTLYLRGDIVKSDVRLFEKNSAVKKVYAENGSVLPENCDSMFYHFYAQEIDLSNADSSGVTSVKSMFSGCVYMTALDLTGFDTSHTNDFDNMFSYCRSITSLDLRSFDTHMVWSMWEMFNECWKLETVDLSSFDITKLAHTDRMFQNCYKLERVYVSDLWTDKTIGYTVNMFLGCENIIGGNGTTYDSTFIAGARARIDRPEIPGYFSKRDVCFYPADGSVRLCGNVIAEHAKEYAHDTRVKTVIAEKGTVLPVDCTALFRYYQAETFDLSKADSSGVSNMYAMFAYCPNAVVIDISGFNTANVTKMTAMFHTCPALKTIVASDQWKVSASADTRMMFTNCTALVGGNGTPFDSANTNGYYACIDKAGQKGYLTDAYTYNNRKAFVLQPVDFTGAVGKTAVFTVEVSVPDYPSYFYQWEYNDGTGWKNSGLTVMSLS